MGAGAHTPPRPLATLPCLWSPPHPQQRPQAPLRPLRAPLPPRTGAGARISTLLSYLTWRSVGGSTWRDQRSQLLSHFIMVAHKYNMADVTLGRFSSSVTADELFNFQLTFCISEIFSRLCTLER